MAISEITRRAIFDELTLARVPWSGRLEEPDFLRRIYSMNDLPSHDYRYTTAYEDVCQHRVNNLDWDADWVFTDPRFQLLDGPDDVFLRFLAETVHPVVRPNAGNAAELVDRYNSHLRPDGYEIHVTSEISGRSVYGARSLVQGVPAIAPLRHRTRVDATYLSQQVTRMEAAIVRDPELAIGTAKELVESVARTILEDSGQPAGPRDDLPGITRAATRALSLDRESIPDAAKAAETIRRLLSNLATVSNGLAELRNAYGTGHGRVAGTSGITPRHARLAVGAASTLATFLLETHAAPLRDRTPARDILGPARRS